MPDNNENPSTDPSSNPGVNPGAAAQQDTPLDETVESPEAEVTQAELLEVLQRENDDLKGRVAELLDASARRDSLAERLTRVAADNERLRRRHGALVIDHAIDQAAADLGISRESAAAFRSRFTCDLDESDQAKITPEPSELLARELHDNPLLRDSARLWRQNRQAQAVAAGAEEVAGADPVELLTALDRNAARKAQFVSRHGPQALIDLAEVARRKGYRQ